MRLQKGIPWIVTACAVFGACSSDSSLPNSPASRSVDRADGIEPPAGGDDITPPNDPPPSDPPAPNDSKLAAASAVGATDGEFNVGQSGDASYSIVLNLLGGTAGVQPTLKLAYNSSSGDSSVGVGWSLAGQSVITHCPTTVAQDGYSDGFDFDSNDKYCLDGQRLVAISGAYGANGTEYRTEVESFSRIYSYGAVGAGPQRFVVHTNTGQILNYGNTNDSRVEAVFVAGTGPAVSAWALNRVEDRAGNYMTYTYFEGVGDDGTGRSGVEHYLTRIDYTGNPAAGSSPYAAVTFEYEQRPDILSGYQSGALAVTRTRLKRIVNTSGTTTLRSYQLTYAPSTAAARSVLTSVQECGYDGTCLAPTTFTGSAVPPGFAAAADVVIAASWAGAGLSNKSTESRHETFADMDGDGDVDRAWVPVGQNSIYVTLWEGLNFGPAKVWLTGPAAPSGGQVPIVSDLGKHEAWLDVNNDGKTDRAWVPAGTKDLYVALSTGTSFSTPQIWLRDQAVAGLTSYSQDGLHETFGDIDGDGRTDYIWIPEGAVGTVRTYAALNTGTGFAAPVDVFPLHTGLPNTSDVGFEDYIDLNNDGLIDYTWIPQGTTQTYATLANDAPGLAHVRFDPPTIWLAEDTRPPNDGAGKPNFRFFEDVTGDGLSDLLFYKVNGSCGEIRVSVNTGKSFLPSRVMSTSCAGAVPIGSVDPRYQQFIDLNDDGRADHVWVPSDRSTIWVAYNQGGITFGAPQELVGAGVGATPRSLSEAFFDVDGDGSIDRIWIPEDTPNGRFYLLKGNLVSHRLEKITNGFGRQIQVIYATLTNPWFYTRDTNATFPLLDAGGSMPIVARTQISDGIGGIRERWYMYEGLKMHLQGFGNLGMRRTKEIETTLPLATVRDFSQDYANRMQGTLIGGATVHQRADATPDMPLPDQLVATTNYVNTFQVTQNGGVYRIRLTKTETEERDLYNTVLSKRVTENLVEDAYGNTTSLRSSTYNSAGMLVAQGVTANTYINDATNWSLGLLTRTDITRSLPNANPTVPAVTRTTAQSWNVAKRQLTQEVVEPNAPEFRVTTDYEYDSFGNRTKTTVTPNGMPARVMTATYDGTGRFALTSTNALGQVIKTPYDLTRGLQTSLTEANNLTVTYGYDGYGRRTLETRPDGVKTRTSFAGCATGCPPFAVYSVTRAVDGQAPSTVYFDVLGRQVRTQTLGLDGRTILQDRTYDTWGRPIGASEPFYSGDTVFWTRAEFDKMGRPIRVTNPDGTVTTTSYRGNTVVDTNELQQSRTEIRDALGKVVEVRDAQSNRLRYRYDAFGDLIEVRDPMEHVTRITLDRWGRKIALDDPDKGRSTYAYDPLGQVTSEADAKAQVTAYNYDALGRTTYRFDHDGTSTSFTYDTAVKGIGGLARVAQTSCVGMTRAACLTALGTTNNYNEVYAYDTLGRVSRVTTTIQGEAFAVSNTYDSLGRADVTTYPAGAGAPLQVRNVYNARGYLSQITNAASGASLWKADSADARGNVTFSTLGNGLVTERRYDPASGRLQRIQTDIHGQVSVQQNAYQFDALGNLVSRRDELQNMTEIASYDALNRLVNIETRRPLETLTSTATYDALGNILTRTGVGTYTYGGTCNGSKAGPHAVTSIGGTGAPSAQSYCYDANGDMIRSGTRDVTYASFGKPTRFVQGSTETLFTYGPDRQRYRRVDASADGNTTTTYIRGYFERSVEPGVTTYRNFIGDFAIYTETVPTLGAVSSSLHYVHRDHLDSVEAITDAQARVVERFSFDPWGKRRNPDWSPASDPGALASNITPRSFTNQEAMDGFNLVHMNGRVYDPTIGRFLSADPFVQSPGNLQSLNRYSYVLDNPLSASDPSGFFSLKKFLKKAFDYTFGKKSLYGAAIRGVRSALRAVAKVWAKVPGLQAVVGAIACVGSFGTACVAYMAFSAAVQLSAGASLGDVLIGAAVAVVSAGIADAVIGTAQQFGAAFAPLGRTASNVGAFAGGVLNGGFAAGIAAEAQGRKFKDAFRSGAIFSAISSAIKGALQWAASPGADDAASAPGSELDGNGAASPAAGNAVQGTGAGSPGPWLTACGSSYCANAQAQQVLNTIWSGQPPDFRVRFGMTGGNAGITFGRLVRLTTDWANLSPEQQIFLLGHEPAHTVQWGKLGVFGFLTRYAKEYPTYGVPPSLAAVPTRSLNIIDPRWSLDQLADRMGHEAVGAARAQGLLP